MRKLSILLVTAILIGIGLTALCTKSNAQTIAEVTKIVSDHNSDFMRWFNARQVDSIMTMYRDDACALPWACGKKQLRTHLQSEVTKGYVFKELKTESVSVCDTIAVEKGTFRIQTFAGEISGMYMSEWHYSNKKWLIVNDIARSY